MKAVASSFGFEVARWLCMAGAFTLVVFPMELIEIFNRSVGGVTGFVLGVAMDFLDVINTLTIALYSFSVGFDVGVVMRLIQVVAGFWLCWRIHRRFASFLGLVRWLLAKVPLRIDDSASRPGTAT